MAEDDRTGSVIDGKYRLERLIGRGGMGTVYAARQLQLDRQVAVKLLRHDFTADDRAVARFNREARAAARIEHPNAVRVYDFGAAADGDAFIAMEFVEGVPLRVMMRRMRILPFDVTLAVIWQAAAAITAAHAAGIVHRDLKPENLMARITDDGTIDVKVVDFGLAKLFEGESTQITSPAEMIGTPKYMAPEQFSGEELDGRVDVYALGVILYEMLAGRPPFDGTFSEVVGKHLYAEPPSFESLGVELPEGVEVVVRRALAKKPLERTSSVNELARSLARCFGVETAAGTSVMAPASLTAREGLPELDFTPGPMLEPEEYATKVADRDDAETIVRPSARPPTAPVAVPPTAPVAVPPARSRAMTIAVPIVLGALALLVVGVIAALVAVRYFNRAPALGETPARSGAAPVPAAPPDRTAPAPEPEADDAHIEGIPFFDEGEMVIYADTIDIEDGATLEITNAGTGRPERFALEPNDDRTRWVVRRTTLSEPSGKTVAELVPVGKLVETVIRNPSGTGTRRVVISRPNE